MSTIVKGAPRKPLSSLIREGFEQHEWWTTGEAAQYAGVKLTTIGKWIRENMFHARSARAGFRVNSSSFKRFIDTGNPQHPAIEQSTA